MGDKGPSVQQWSWRTLIKIVPESSLWNLRLGCYRLMIGSFTQMIKYWHYIKTEVDNSSLIYKVVSFMENRESLGQHNWLSTIKFILHYCGMDDTWLNPHTINNGSIAPKCSVILRNKFVDYWSSLLHDQHSSAHNGEKTEFVQ